jgi:protein SCO1/2
MSRLVLLALVCAPAAALAQTTAPPILAKADVEERLGAPVPLELTFRDEDGRPVALRTVAGGAPIVLVLAYYRCPMLCGLVLEGVRKALAKIDLEGHRLVTVSFDPADTPDEARAARDRVGAPNSAFLVGDPVTIERLTQAVGFRYAWDPDTRQFAHPAVVMVLTGDGRLSRYLYGIEPAPRDLRLALLEAGEGKIGSFVDRVLLTCYRWDPAARRYGPAIQGFIRIGSLVIFVAVAAGMAVLWRRDRRRQAGTP